MSNRTDYDELVRELATHYELSPELWERIETELHNAHVAGQEGSPCLCRWCANTLEEEMERTEVWLHEDFAPIVGVERTQDSEMLKLEGLPAIGHTIVQQFDFHEEPIELMVYNVKWYAGKPVLYVRPLDEEEKARS